MKRARALVVLVVAALGAAPAAASAADPAPATPPTSSPTPAPTLPAPEPTVPDGVSAGGVDLSGATLAEAQTRLEATIGPRVRRPFVLRVGHRRFALRAKTSKLDLDALTTAKRAVRATAPGEVPVKLTHHRRAVRRWLHRVAKKVNRPARDAKIRITLRHMHVRHAKVGKALHETGLARIIDRALDDPAAAQRAYRTKLGPVYPPVNYNDIRRQYSTVITVDKAHFTLRLFKWLKISRRYSVAVGQPAYPTPSGLYSIVNKQVDPVWSVPNSPWAGELQGTTVEGGSAANPLKARWMGIVNGVGIHGTGEDASIGSAASHGCIRMHVSDVVDLYPRVPVGTPVLIK
ncbi:MAG TPA: L,D-transpeptidase [Baekduia sp.]|nr:L,D-transpeptidase [Baekduia sp.]